MDHPLALFHLLLSEAVFNIAIQALYTCVASFLLPVAGAICYLNPARIVQQNNSVAFDWALLLNKRINAQVEAAYRA